MRSIRRIDDLEAIIVPFISIETDKCVEYPYLNVNGYGDIQYYNDENKKRHCLAHRLAYETANNTKLVSEQLILHSCDNPKCVNPRHLRIGTHLDNVRDRDSRGRQAKGKQNGRYSHGHTSLYEPIHKAVTPWEGLCGRSLNKDNVAEIKDAIKKRGTTSLKELSEILGVKYQTIRDISAGRVYTSI